MVSQLLFSKWTLCRVCTYSFAQGLKGNEGLAFAVSTEGEFASGWMVKFEAS